MPFIVEKIPEDALKNPNAKKIGFNITLSPDWAIDYEHNAFIIINNKTGGAYDGTIETEYYTLSWNNELIHITASPLPKTFTENGAIMSWKIHDIKIPNALSDHEQAIIKLVKEAFSAIGEAFNGDRFTKVNVKFRPSAYTKKRTGNKNNPYNLLLSRQGYSI